jgi:hypothetical protein
VIRFATAEIEKGGALRVVPGSPMACAVCGSDEVMAVAPGSEDETLAGVTGAVRDRVVVTRGVAAKTWCAACWPWRAR